MTAEPNKGIIWGIMSGNAKGRLVKLENMYFPVDYVSVETYPLKNVQIAWQELVSGSGFIASIDQGISEVIVREVTMGYFDSYEPQKYAQPVYVFKGDNNFVGYVAAVGEISNRR